MQDDFGDRMKAYEKVYTGEKLEAGLPVYARLDGRSFSKFTNNMQRPFDYNMSAAMVATAEYLAKDTKAEIAYTQSDEISLLWKPALGDSEFMFDGKLQKISSVLAGMCSAKFVMEYINFFGSIPSRPPAFDCRILTLPSLEEWINMLLWRQKDAFKNAVQSSAHYYFGHKKLMKVSTKEKLSMMNEIGIDFFNNYPDSFKYGTEFKRVSETRMLTDAEMANIPSPWRPTEPVTRTVYKRSYPVHVGEKYVL